MNMVRMNDATHNAWTRTPTKKVHSHCTGERAEQIRAEQGHTNVRKP